MGLTFLPERAIIQGMIGRLRQRGEFVVDSRLEGFIDATAMIRSGVYVLSNHGRVVYVGKSKAPLTRIYAHRNLARKRPVPWLSIRGVVFDAVHIMPCHPDQIDALEQSLIAEFQPQGNIQHNPAYHAPQIPLIARRPLLERRP